MNFVLPERKTSLLRKGRVSISGSRYFITCNCVRPASDLCHSPVANSIRSAWSRIASDGDGVIHAATIMPDHIHMLLALSGQLKIGQVVGKMKSLTRSGLSAHGLQWQPNFFEHRLRAEEDANSYAYYIFMNPYRAGVIDRMQVWPHWWLDANTDFDFLALLQDAKYPPKEWIEQRVAGWEPDSASVGESV